MNAWTQPYLFDVEEPAPVQPPSGLLWCPQCDEEMNSTMFAFNHHTMYNGVCVTLHARLTAAEKHLPARAEVTALGNLFITCECGWKGGQAAHQNHLLTAPVLGAFLLEEK